MCLRSYNLVCSHSSLHINDSVRDEAEDQVIASEGIRTGMDCVPGFEAIECLHRCVCMPMMCPRPKTR